MLAIITVLAPDVQKLNLNQNSSMGMLIVLSVNKVLLSHCKLFPVGMRNSPESAMLSIILGHPEVSFALAGVVHIQTEWIKIPAQKWRISRLVIVVKNNRLFIMEKIIGISD